MGCTVRRQTVIRLIQFFVSGIEFAPLWSQWICEHDVTLWPPSLATPCILSMKVTGNKVQYRCYLTPIDGMLGLLLQMHAPLSVQSHKDQMAWSHLLKVVFLQLPGPKVHICRLTLGGVSLKLTSRGADRPSVSLSATRPGWMLDKWDVEEEEDLDVRPSLVTSLDPDCKLSSFQVWSNSTSRWGYTF